MQVTDKKVGCKIYIESIKGKTEKRKKKEEREKEKEKEKSPRLLRSQGRQRSPAPTQGAHVALGWRVLTQEMVQPSSGDHSSAACPLSVFLLHKALGAPAVCQEPGLGAHVSLQIHLTKSGPEPLSWEPGQLLALGEAMALLWAGSLGRGL